tara:strand:- start:23 stop:331 length:309 start_codon:yes stop_codon:yes gene_type:complete
MRSIAYCILIPCLLFLCLGTASAHPHKSGQSDHGPSLENYLIDLDFTIGNVVKEQKKKIIIFSKHGKNKKSMTIKNTNRRNKNLEIKKINNKIITKEIKRPE